MRVLGHYSEQRVVSRRCAFENRRRVSNEIRTCFDSALASRIPHM